MKLINVGWLLLVLMVLMVIGALWFSIHTISIEDAYKISHQKVKPPLRLEIKAPLQFEKGKKFPVQVDLVNVSDRKLNMSYISAQRGKFLPLGIYDKKSDNLAWVWLPDHQPNLNQKADWLKPGQMRSLKFDLMDCRIMPEEFERIWQEQGIPPNNNGEFYLVGWYRLRWSETHWKITSVPLDRDTPENLEAHGLREEAHDLRIKLWLEGKESQVFKTRPVAVRIVSLPFSFKKLPIN
jgi:hypothetical protein